MIAGAAPSVFSDDFEMKKFAEFFQNFYKASTYANLFLTGCPYLLTVLLRLVQSCLKISYHSVKVFSTFPFLHAIGRSTKVSGQQARASRLSTKQFSQMHHP